MRFLVIAVLMLLSFAPAPAQSENLTVYIGKLPPLVMVDGDGQVSGAAVEVVEAMMRKVGKPLNREAMVNINWARAIDDTEHRIGSMMFCVARTPQREHLFKWVGPIAELNLGLVARKDSGIVIGHKSDVGTYRIGVIRNSAPMHVLENTYGVAPTKLELVKSDVIQFKMLASARVDMITQADLAAPLHMKELGLNQSEYEMVHVLKHLELYAAFNLNTEDTFILAAQEALDSLKISEGGIPSQYERIMNRYLDLGPISVKN